MTPMELGDVTAAWTIRFRRQSKHPAARVWRAITEPDAATAWMGCTVEIDLRVGGHWHARNPKETEPWLAGVIARVEPERRLAYCWGLCVIDWTIEPAAEGCHYTFVASGNATSLPEPSGNWSPWGTAAGWHGWLESLDAHMDAAQKPAWREFEERVQPSYRRMIEDTIRVF